tara:strand:+ start:1696 stop:1947 length:252 start_codon:yes stop_codon:yes gene_type:complete
MPETMKTTSFLTKFEFARIVGMRALDLSMKNDGQESNEDLQKLAKEEVLNKKVNMTIRRYLPNGKYEDRELVTLKVDHVLYHL